MGGRGSTRWNDYQKAPLVEDTPAIDLVALRRSGALAEPEATFKMTWTVGGEVVGVAQAHVSETRCSRR